MTKVNYDSAYIDSKVIYKLEDTISSLDNISKMASNTRIPSGFNSSKYVETINKVRQIKKGLRSIESDLKKAKIKYENAENNAIRNVNNCDMSKKILYDEVIVKPN